MYQMDRHWLIVGVYTNLLNVVTRKRNVRLDCGSNPEGTSYELETLHNAKLYESINEMDMMTEKSYTVLPLPNKS